MKRKKEIENSINQITGILNKLKPALDSSKDYNKSYNKLLIKRAELRKKLSGHYTDNIVSLFKNLNCLRFKKSEKLICDYFSCGKL